MALALYRKYRPRTFAEVIGQEHVTEPLSQALRTGRLHHAYLFSGPRGCGKTSSARILARSLNCEQGPTPEPCGVCASCRALANNGPGSIDVIEIDAASHGGVDDARDLREKAFFAPASSRYKIYVIDEAHMVSPAGFNALLKLVEEPPEYVKFIFATTEPEKVLGTIKSRTHHYPFRLIPPAVLRPYLQQLTEAEGIAVEPAVYPLVVRAGGGSARDTLSVLDQLIAGAGPDGVSYARAVALLGVTDVTLIDEMCDALAAGDGAAAYSTIDRVAEAGHDARRFASDLLERFRDLIILQQVPDAVAKGLIDGPADQVETMTAQATRLGPATLSRCADIVHNGLVEMRGTTAPRLLLELITARMLLPGADDSTGALLQRLERMERRLTLSGDSFVRPNAEPAVDGVPGHADATPDRGSDGASAIEGAVGPSSSGGGLSAARAAAAAASRRSAGAGPVRRPAGEPGQTEEAVRRPGGEPGQVEEAVRRPAGEPGQTEEAVRRPAGEPGQTEEAVRRSGGEPARAAEAVRRSGGEPGQAEEAADAPAEAAQPAESGDGSQLPAEFSGLADAAAVSSPASGGSDGNASGGGGGLTETDYHDDEPPWEEEPQQHDAEPMAGPDRQAAEPVEPAGVTPDASQSSEPGRRRRAEPAGVMPDAPEEPAAAAVEDAVPGQLTAAAVREVWPEIVTAIGRQSKRLAALLAGAVVRDFDGQTVTLTFRYPKHAEMVAPAAPTVADALYEALGGRWEIRCEVSGDGGAGSPAPAPAQAQAPAPRNGSGRGPAGGGREPIRNDAGVTGVGPGRAAPTASGAQQAQAAAPRPPQSRRREAEAPASSGGDDDWPEPVKPGGRTAVTPPPDEPEEEEDWPEVHPVGGSGPAAADAVARDSADPVGTASAVATRPATFAGATGGSRGSGDDQNDYAGRAEAPDRSGRGQHEGGEVGLAAPATASDPVPRDNAMAGRGSGTVTAGDPVPTDNAMAGRGSGTATAGDPVPTDNAMAGRGSGTASGPGRSGSAAEGMTGNASAELGAPGRPGGNAAPRSGLAAARAAAAAAANSPARQAATSAAPARPAAAPARQGTAGTGAATSGWSDGSPTEEAPYDPEYDGPPSGGAGPAYEGFDPGDEPLDDVIDEKTARASSEQQAMRLLQDAFGAEKIGEV